MPLFKVYNSECFIIFTKLYNYSHYLILEHFHNLKKKLCAHKQSFPFPVFPALETTFSLHGFAYSGYFL